MFDWVWWIEADLEGVRMKEWIFYLKGATMAPHPEWLMRVVRQGEFKDEQYVQKLYPGRLLGSEELTEDLKRNMPIGNPEFTEWARGRLAMMDESMFPKSASAEDKPVKRLKVPELPLEVYSTVPFDKDKAWDATKAMSEGM